MNTLKINDMTSEEKKIIQTLIDGCTALLINTNPPKSIKSKYETAIKEAKEKLLK